MLQIWTIKAIILQVYHKTLKIEWKLSLFGES